MSAAGVFGMKFDLIMHTKLNHFVSFSRALNPLKQNQYQNAKKSCFRSNVSPEWHHLAFKCVLSHPYIALTAILMGG